MTEQTKTPEQLRQEMIEKLQKEQATFMQEVAMPGVVQKVSPKGVNGAWVTPCPVYLSGGKSFQLYTITTYRDKEVQK